MSERVIVGFAGAMGAGKTSGASYLRERLGFRYLRYSQILAKWLGDDRATKAELQAFGWEIMRERQHELNERLIADIDTGESYAIDGLRCRIDQDSLQERFAGRFALIFVDASVDVRRRRLIENGRHPDAAAFEVADGQAVEGYLRSLRPTAHAVLVNETSVDLYYEDLMKIVNALRPNDRR